MNIYTLFCINVITYTLVWVISFLSYKTGYKNGVKSCNPNGKSTKSENQGYVNLSKEELEQLLRENKEWQNLIEYTGGDDNG